MSLQAFHHVACVWQDELLILLSEGPDLCQHVLGATGLVSTNHHACRAVTSHVHFAKWLLGRSGDYFGGPIARWSVVALVSVGSSLCSVWSLICYRGMRLQIIKVNIAQGRLVRRVAILVRQEVFALAARLYNGDVISCLPIMLIVVVVHLIASLTLDRTEADVR